MKILFLEWNCYAGKYIENAFISMGHTVNSFALDTSANLKNDEKICTDLVSVLLANRPDFCFSMNYFPVVAIACKACNISYVSWTYDSPYAYLYSDTIHYETNFAFIFDRSEYNNLHYLGVERVFYMPMGVPADPPSYNPKLLKDYFCDISFIGSLYNEPKHKLFDKLLSISEYSQGYLNALVEAQKFLYGTDIIEPALSGNLLSELQHAAPFLNPADEFQRPEWMYSKYFCQREVTRRERLEYLHSIPTEYTANLYTNNRSISLPGFTNRGPVDYYAEMPEAIHASKICLNISLRSIISGIPLRCFDILGNGSLLMTNYQSELFDFFEPDKDFVYYDNPDDFREKLSFYLTHDSLREKIAQSGYNNVITNHTYEKRVSEIINYL